MQQQQGARQQTARHAAILQYRKVGRSEFQQMQTTAKLTRKTVSDMGVPAASDKAIPCFEWDERTERAQADQYMAHLSQNINLGSRDLTWVETANTHPRLLSSDTRNNLGRNCRGNTDVVVADRGAVKAHLPQLWLHLLFELKKAIKPGHVYQAMARLIVANILCPELQPVMVRFLFLF